MILVLTIYSGILTLIVGYILLDFLKWKKEEKKYEQKRNEQKVKEEINKDLITSNELKDKLQNLLKDKGIPGNVEVKVIDPNTGKSPLEGVPKEILNMLGDITKKPDMEKHIYESFEVKEVNLKERFEEEERLHREEDYKNNILGNEPEDDE